MSYYHHDEIVDDIVTIGNVRLILHCSYKHIAKQPFFTDSRCGKHRFYIQRDLSKADEITCTDGTLHVPYKVALEILKSDANDEMIDKLTNKIVELRDEIAKHKEATINTIEEQNVEMQKQFDNFLEAQAHFKDSQKNKDE